MWGTKNKWWQKKWEGAGKFVKDCIGKLLFNILDYWDGWYFKVSV